MNIRRISRREMALKREKGRARGLCAVLLGLGLGRGLGLGSMKDDVLDK
jgi:hypothetical protein